MLLSSKEGWERYGTLFSDPEINLPFLLSVKSRIYESGENAGAFIEKYPGTWECHYLVKVGGKAAVKSTREVLKEFFENEDAVLISGLISIENRAAKIFTRKMGFTSLGTVAYPEGEYEVFLLFKKDFMNG